MWQCNSICSCPSILWLGVSNEPVYILLYGEAVTCPRQPYTRQLLPLFLSQFHLAEKARPVLFLDVANQQVLKWPPQNLSLQFIPIWSSTKNQQLFKLLCYNFMGCRETSQKLVAILNRLIKRLPERERERIHSPWHQWSCNHVGNANAAIIYTLW